MNRKLLIIICVSLFLLIVVSLGFLFFKKDSEGNSVLSNVLPFGNPGSETINFIPGGNTDAGFRDPESSPLTNLGEGQLRRISETPTTGSSIFERSGETLVRFVEKATGHIYEVNLESGERTRVTNTTVAKMQEALWGKSSDSIILRAVKNGMYETLLGQISSSTATTTRELKTTDLAQNIQNIVYSPKKDKIFQTTITFQGIEGSVTNQFGTNPRLVWNYPATEWNAEWPAENIISLTTKAAHGIDGFLFFLNPNTKSFEHIFTEKGLVTRISPDGNKIIYSSSKDKITGTYVKNIKENSELSGGFSTIADKCLWKNNNEILCAIPKESLPEDTPDSWYKGSISFNDKLWKTEILTGETEVIADLSSSDGAIDAIHLSISPNEKFVVLTNKKDGRLWAIELP